MRAAVLTEVNKPLQILDLEQEPPKSKEVRVRVKAAGVCMSDWHIMGGLAVAAAHGARARGRRHRRGERAGGRQCQARRPRHLSFRPHCGRCRYCFSGQTVLCIGHNDTPRWRMHDGTARVKLNGEPVNQMARIGTFSEEVVCPAEQVVKIRADLPFTHAAIIGCSGATGIGAVIRHARVPAGSSVLVVGCGGVGLNVVQGAQLAGANPIIACELRDNKLDYARNFGATHTINATNGNVVERVREMTEGLGVNTAFDAIGSEQTALQVIDAVAPGGRAVLVGIPAFATRAPINPSQIVYGEKVISGTYYGSVRPNIDFPILADLDLEKKINLDDLISRTYRFDEINEGFALMLAGEVPRGVIMFD